MEKMILKGNVNHGLATLPTQRQVGQPPSQSQTDIRKWKSLKARVPKGLSEIEQMDREEVRIRMMQALERFMRAHPAIWGESSVQLLLAEIADAQRASPTKGNHLGGAHEEERVQTIITGLLAPMVQILEAQQLAAEKAHQDTLALQKVREERDKALLQLEQESDRVARQDVLCASILQDLEEMGKTIEESRYAAQEAENRLMEVLLEQQELITHLVRGGPATFVQWAREAMKERGLELEDELERIWREATPRCQDQLMVPEDKLPLPLTPQSSVDESERVGSPDQSTRLHETKRDAGSRFQMTHIIGGMAKLLWLAASEVFQQMVQSYNRVEGPLSLPSVMVGFWFGLACRMISLAAVTVLPKVRQYAGLSVQ